MRSWQLFTIAASHGVNLRHAAAMAAPPRERTPLARIIEQLQRKGIPRELTARGRQTHVTRRITWSQAELGMAAVGVEPIPWAAAMYVYARDRGFKRVLVLQLSREAFDLAERYSWPITVQPAAGDPKHYLTELAELVLDDEYIAAFRVAPTLYAHYMGVEPATWEKHLEAKFYRLKQRFNGWIHVADAVVNTHLEEYATPIAPHDSRDARHIAQMREAPQAADSAQKC